MKVHQELGICFLFCATVLGVGWYADIYPLLAVGLVLSGVFGSWTVAAWLGSWFTFPSQLKYPVFGALVVIAVLFGAAAYASVFYVGPLSITAPERWLPFIFIGIGYLCSLVACFLRGGTPEKSDQSPDPPLTRE